MTGDIVTYGYEKNASLIFTVTPPANAKSGVLKGEAQWLVCQETCVPATYAFSLNIPISKLPTPATDVSSERGKVPQPFRNWKLSAKATAGFLSRARSGSLRFPEGFLATLEHHLERMREELAAAV